MTAKTNRVMIAAQQSDALQAIIALFGSSVVTAVIGVLGALIQGRFVSPEDLGYFRQFEIVTGYLFFLHFGVFHAIERLYPYYIGRGERDKAIKAVEIGNAWMLIVCIPVCTAFVIVAGLSFAYGNWKSGLGWGAQAFAVYCSLYGGFLSATYRSGQDFKRMAKAQLYGPVFSLITIPIYWAQSYIALFVKSISSIVTVWQLHRNRPLHLHFRFQWAEWRQLISQGLPRFTASYIMTTGLDAIRATIILHQLGTTQLGYWSFSWMVILIAMQLPQAITAVYIPKIIELYGQSNSASKALALSYKPLVSGLVALALIVPLSILGTLYVLPLLLPRYSQAVGVVCVLLISLPFKLVEAPANILNAMNQLAWLNACAVANAVLQLITIVIGLHFGLGLYSMAIGVVVGQASRALMIWALLVVLCRKEKARDMHGGLGLKFGS